MSHSVAIQHAFQEHGLGEAVRGIRVLGGGHGGEVVRVEIENGDWYVAKIMASNDGDRLSAEADGLTALSAGWNGIRVPRVWAPISLDGTSVMLMEALDPIRSGVPESSWRPFGMDLARRAALAEPSRYGWDRDNWIGATAQPNAWCDDWVEFNRVHRLGYQLSLVERRGLLCDRDADTIRRVIDRLDAYIPHHPCPVLLHGDLWSGNAIPIQEDGRVRIAVIDPAVYVGDGLADLAMMRLFGGFHESCFDAYQQETHDSDRIETRVLVYQLYHMLNHLNLFGGSYATSSVSIARRLLG